MRWDIIYLNKDCYSFTINSNHVYSGVYLPYKYLFKV